MICYDKRYLRTSRVNTIVEPHFGKGDEGEEVVLGYIYSDKTTYTDCILLQNKFDGNLATMVSQLAPSEKHMPAVNFYFENAPKPFNMLAPYLGLMSTSIELENDIEELTSRLFIMSKSIGFNAFIQVPKNLRMSLIFSASEFMRYKAEIDEYKRFMYESMKEESPSEVIYISSEEVERFGHFVEQFRDMGIMGTTQASYNSAPAYDNQVNQGGYLDPDFDPNNVDEKAVQAAIDSGAVPQIDFSALFGDPANSTDTTQTANTNTSVTAQPVETQTNTVAVGAAITDDGGVQETDGIDILDMITRGVSTDAQF